MSTLTEALARPSSVAASRSLARPIVRVQQGRPADPQRPVRLTRRGRVVVVLALLAALLVVGFTLGHASGSQAAGSAAAQTVVVQPGDTLWSIAARVAPDRDPRGVVARLALLNRLTGAQLQVGERLHLPA